MQKTLRKKRIFYGVPIETLWQAITDSNQLEEWFMENNFIGGENNSFEFLDKPGEKWKGVFHGEIISYQPTINIAYSWSHNKLRHTTYVWWKLHSQGENTTIEIEHSGFKGISDYFASFNYSKFWNRKLNGLLSYISRERDKVEI
jgi:uncharacterized protein YndB with AHSA1/START domain